MVDLKTKNGTPISYFDGMFDLDRGDDDMQETAAGPGNLVLIGDLLAAEDEAKRELVGEAYARNKHTIREPPSVFVFEQELIADIMVLGQISLSAARDAGLMPHHFGSQRFASVFRAVSAMIDSGEVVSVAAICGRLHAEGSLESFGGPEVIEAIPDKGTSSIPTSASAAHATANTRAIVDASRRRELATACHLGAAMAMTGDGTSAEIADKTIRKVEEIDSESVSTLASIEEVSEEMSRTLAVLGGKKDTLPTGFIDLDKYLDGGISPAELTLIAARPSIGKSTIMFQMAGHLSVRIGLPTLVFSIEMKPSAVYTKITTAICGVDPKTRDNRESTGRFAGTKEQVLRSGILVDKRESLAIGAIRATAISARRKHGIGAIFVDYLQLVNPDERNGDSRNLDVGDVSKGLKALARALEIPVVAAVQVGRRVDERTNKRPNLGDLRESGNLEQDADLVLFIYREEYYSRGNTPESEKGVAEVIVGKNRNGPAGGTVRLGFDGLRFFNLDSRDHDDE